MALEYPSVQDIVNRVSQDVRQQVGSANPVQLPILIDYTNRIHKQMLRFSRWEFLRSDPVTFMTAFGQTDYWIGPSAGIPAGTIDTGLNLNDVDRIEKDSMRDMSNNLTLMALGAQPLGYGLNARSGLTRPNRPKVFWQDRNNVNLLHVYPGADNQNSYSPVPNPPGIFATVGGALLQRTYFFRVTFVDSLGGESGGSSVSVSQTIPANSLATVITPYLYFNKTSSGVVYSSYNVYAATQEGSETKQNATPIELGSNWIEPTSGLISTGTTCPNTSTLASMGGYIIQFRYYKDRLDLTDVGQTLQIPNDYFDVVCDGVNYLTWRLLGRADEAQAAYEAYKQGMTAMVWDKNLFPETDFMRVDPATYVNNQILGVLPENF